MNQSVVNKFIAEVRIFAPKLIPEIKKGDDLSTMIGDAVENSGEKLKTSDLLVIAQKVVSKAEGRFVNLAQIKPSKSAQSLSQITGKDPRFIEVILGESDEVIRVKDNVMITAHKLGIIHANAGIDRSNVHESDGDIVLLLPKNPDASAKMIQLDLSKRFKAKIGVIINDTAGRAWRNGIIGFAIGVAGFEPIRDLRGENDKFGRPLAVTQVAIADEAAAAASMLQGQAAEGMPVVVIRGIDLAGEEGCSESLIRKKSEDLFR